MTTVSIFGSPNWPITRLPITLHGNGFFAIFLCFLAERRYAMSESPHTESDVLDDVVDETKIKEPARAILFNDEIHTFDEVINQIIKALKCNRAKAESLTWEVHSTGKSCVYIGGLGRCLEITRVLEEIQLMTQIEV
jgi:ATP-dependent Clp protease adapter protein ClpS